MISILEEAKAVRQDRAARVDAPAGNFARIAKTWEVVFGHPVTTKQVALAMIGLKLARECYKPWRDNLVDLAGYADCADEIERTPTVAEYDPLEEVYKFRQQCQEERERDATRPVCGDGPEAKGGNAEVRGDGEANPLGAVQGNCDWRTCSRAGCPCRSWYGPHSHRICT